jgi:PPOX class probable F420-dependent enzyme
MVSDVDRLTAGKYVLVTTFRKNGTPVPTPVWVVRDGGEILIWTVVNTGKVKRIRNNPAVELTECDIRGRPRGAAVKGTARILDEAGAEHVRRLIKAKFGLVGWASVLGSTIRRGKKGTIGIAISVP